MSAETYSLDSASNLSSKTVDSLTTSYTYDAINQLLTESNTGYSATYSYDANGNRASQVLNGTTYSYSYDSGDKLNTITSGGTTFKSYAYDGAGRTHTVTTSAGTTTLSYDYEDRVTGITYPSSATNSFTYNGLDTRVGKVDSTGTSTYKRDGAGVTAPVLSDGSIAYTPGTSERKSGASIFDHGNYLRTFTRQTNSSQTTTATRVYDAFGNLVSTTGTPQSPFGFVGGQGYQEDSDSGLKLLGHRYYDPSAGRFVTRDRGKDGRNWYCYAENNPNKWADPQGKWVIIALAIIGVAAALYGLYELGKWAHNKITEGRAKAKLRVKQIVDSGDPDNDGSGGGTGDHSGVGGNNPTSPTLGGPITEPINQLHKDVTDKAKDVYGYGPVETVGGDLGPILHWIWDHIVDPTLK